MESRFDRVKNKKMFWIYKIQALNPKGLNELTEKVN